MISIPLMNQTINLIIGKNDLLSGTAITKNGRILKVNKKKID
jgi:hypothetical protein